MTIAHHNRELVRAAFDDWAAGRRSFFDTLADDATWTIPGSTAGAGEWRGRQAYVDEVMTPLLERLSTPVVPHVEGIWADADEVIIRWRQDTPLRAGGSYRNDYAWFITIQDDVAVSVTAFLDLAAYAAVIGADA